jgi:hypothetical protein
MPGCRWRRFSRLVGHSGTTVTELVYRHQLKPVIQTGATVMDRLVRPAPAVFTVDHPEHAAESERLATAT